jgi:hypothetical protein
MDPVDLLGEGQRLPNLSSSGSVERVPSARKGKLSFTTELIEGDKFDLLISACGFSVAANVATPTTDLSAQKTLTFALWEAGRKKMLHGCSGKLEIECGGPGQRVMCKWEFEGIWNAPTDAAMPALAPILTKGYTGKGLALTIAGAGIAPINSFNVKTGSDIQMRADLTTASGIGYFFTGDILPTLSLDPEARLVATSDVFGKLLAGTAEAVSLTLTDAASNTFIIAAPKAQRISIDSEERNKVRVDKTEFELHVSTGNDQLSITST